MIGEKCDAPGSTHVARQRTAEPVSCTSGILQLKLLAERPKAHNEWQGCRGETCVLLAEFVHRRRIARGEVMSITASRGRTARALPGTPLGDGLLRAGPTGPLLLRFPVEARVVSVSPTVSPDLTIVLSLPASRLLTPYEASCPELFSGTPCSLDSPPRPSARS